jgi:Flp pilus assembly protein TadB
MLWITGTLLLIAWAVATFIFHKSGMIHMLLMAAIAFYIVQFAQDRRTKEYQRSFRK